jgi:hypothetical protein
MYLWCSATGIIVTVQNDKPGKTLRTLGTADFNLAFWCLALSLNVLLSGLILGRLLRARANAAATLGSAHARTYTSIAAIITESAGLYAMFGLAWVIMYGMKSLGGFMLLQVLVQIEVRSPVRCAHLRWYSCSCRPLLQSSSSCASHVDMPGRPRLAKS